MSRVPQAIIEGLWAGEIIPYLGSGVLGLGSGTTVPDSPEQLAQYLTSRVTVPHKIRRNLTAAGQYIENFKHRKTLTGLLTEAFRERTEPTVLHRFLAQKSNSLPLIVDVWYDAAMADALADRGDFGQVQGVSQADGPGEWVRYYGADGSPADPAAAEQWATLLYKPLGAVLPASHFVVSDSDYVEILTEIDIQTPIPPRVQELRRGRRFLFLGCRFRTQLERSFARQIVKRSSSQHWALLEGELTRNEARFLAEQGIERIDMPLAEFVAELMEASSASPRAEVA
ncbi:MAG TPA: SIR2 family protein [Methylococcus sp.]|nr:SIR2 family protein [Methylococcus sp.]